MSDMDVAVDRRVMVEGLLAVIDRRDADGLAERFEPDGIQQFGNQQPLHGRDAIRAGNRQFLSTIAGLRHEITGLWEVESTVIIRLLVHYERIDGALVTLPAITIFTESSRRLIEHYQVWFDVNPLYG